jgi:hypothetical protein
VKNWFQNLLSNSTCTATAWKKLAAFLKSGENAEVREVRRRRWMERRKRQGEGGIGGEGGDSGGVTSLIQFTVEV